jgi:glycosyltransferase involved in cell wall biosynthesis
LLVSICIPAYRAPHLLKRCLDSVAMQDFPDYEVIVSDDSGDSSVENVVETHRLKNKIRYFKNEQRLGSPLNWNKAIGHAEGKYIKMLHHDDYFLREDSLNKFVTAMTRHPESFLAFSYTEIHFLKTSDVFIHKQGRGQLKRLLREPEFLFFRNIIGAPSATIFRRSVTMEFNKNYRWLVDVEFYMRLLQKSPKTVCIPEALVAVSDGEEGQITQNVHNDRNTVINENLMLFSEIFTPALDRPRSWLYFQELFESFSIDSKKELTKDFDLPVSIESFVDHVFEDMRRSKFFKRIKKRLLTSRYNKRIFKIERF